MSSTMRISDSDHGPRGILFERRRYRRHDFEERNLTLDRFDPTRQVAEPIGEVVDLSAGGVRVRTDDTDIKPDTQIRVRLRLPVYAGISPFIERGMTLKPRNEWVGWMSVRRVRQVDGQTEVAGELMEMEDIDRGMLSLYLSTQPMAA